MFDIGWSELLVIGALALIVVGPKDLPVMMRRLGQYVGKARSMARDFQRTMEDAAKEADVAELRDVQRSIGDFNRKIGADAPRKYAESLMKEPKKGEAGAPPPEAGSHDAADAAENAAWEGEQAAAGAEAEADRIARIERAAAELEADAAPGEDDGPDAPPAPADDKPARASRS